MQTENLTWQRDGMSIELGADWSGQGPLVLLLPALSSISTRREMHPLQERLSATDHARKQFELVMSQTAALGALSRTLTMANAERMSAGIEKVFGRRKT